MFPDDDPTEHEKARAQLGPYSDDYPGQAMTARATPFADIVLNVLDDLPLVRPPPPPTFV